MSEASSVKTAGPKFTASQQRAIAASGPGGGGVLVSAAAGSGKTATLAARVAHLVCDPAIECGIDQILVVTFTENAASEMRQRIERVLQQKARECGTPHARRQAMLSGRAAVGTIHGFCSRLLRQHFARLGIDPKFEILSAQQMTLLQSATLREVLDDTLESPGAAALESLTHWYGNGDDHRISDLVLKLYRLTSSVVSPEQWRTDAVARITQAAADPKASGLGREFITETTLRVAELRGECEQVGKLMEARGFPMYAGYIRQYLLPWVETWEEQVASGRLWREAVETEAQRLPSVGKGVAGKDAAKARMDALKEAILTGPFPLGVPADEGFWRSSLSACEPHVRELVRLSGAFDAAYRRAKDARHALDYGDLERLALRLLTDADGGPSTVARSLHTQYRFVMVDECQDTNAVQDRILSLVSTECLEAGESNLFSVGDRKQSIYRFRLAEPQLFEQRERRYQSGEMPGEVIRLSENFRSRGPLLGAINAVFERLMVGGRTEIDYASGHALLPGPAYPEATSGGAPVELHLLPKKPKGSAAESSAAEYSAAETSTAESSAAESSAAEGHGSDAAAQADDLDVIEREAELIARRIRALMGTPGSPRARVFDKDLGGVRDIRYADIAVLLRVAKGKAKLMASRLRRRGIPVQADATGGLLEAQEVRDVLAVLQLLDDTGQDVALAAYLRSPLAKLDQAEEAMARARVAFPAVAFHSAVRMYAESGVDAYAVALAGSLARVEGWRDLSRRRTIADLLEQILRETHYTTYVVGLIDGEQRQANLLELLETARSYSAQSGSHVGGFTAYLRALEDDENDLDQPSTLAGDADVVRVLTVHKAKGLEYAVVFLPDMGNNFNLRDLSGTALADRDTLLAIKAPDESRQVLYPTPAWALAGLKGRPKRIAEELRVLYVAMTRAREHLIVIATAKPEALGDANAVWQGHTGPLPESAVLSAKNPLEWVLAVNAAAGEKSPFAPATYSEEEVQIWAAEARSGGVLKVEADIAALRPLPGSVLHGSAVAAQEVTDRLGWVNPHLAATRRRAAMSVTALTHPEPGARAQTSFGRARDDEPAATKDDEVRDEPYLDAALPEPDPVPPELDPVLRELKLPREIVEDTAELAATERGTATHLALEHLDFNTDCSRKGLAAQVEAMAADFKLTGREASSVQIASLLFVATHEVLGPLLRGERGRVFNELPVYMPHTHSGEAPTDRRDYQMVRGRIDVMVETADGMVVIDYKTDRVWGQRLAERVELYSKQVAFYRLAAEAISGRRCAGVYLAFIDERAREVVRV